MPLKMKLVKKNENNLSIMRIWIRSFRLHYVPTSIFPALLGSIIAWAEFRELNLWYFLMVIIGVTLHHIGLNMIDDVFDYLHAVDSSASDDKNPYTGGSGVLTEKLLPVNHMLAAAIFCYLLAFVVAIYLTITVGWLILIFCFIGLFSSVFYTVPPIRYGYRGFGELSLLINYGPVICLGAFYVQTQSKDQ